MSGPSGLVIVDKPAGMTSHDVVGRARRLLGTRRVGHAGTLDPMATGMLVLGANRATRLLGHLAGHDKTYRATIRLGVGTVTDDAEGEVVACAGAAGIDEAAVRAVMARLTGGILQRPSAVSAIKVDGQRAYDRVRAGEDVRLEPRAVTVHRFDLLALRPATVARPEGADPAPTALEVVDLDVEVDCSTGTYIRALARDMGEALGTGGHLTALRRTRVGPFDIADAQALPPRTEDPDPAATLELVGIDDAARMAFEWLEVSPDQARDVGYGRTLHDLRLPADPSALVGPDGTFLGLYRQSGADARPEAVFVGNP